MCGFFSSPFQDAPMFISSPHFFNADPSLLESVGGLNPNENEHGTLLEMNPVSALCGSGASFLCRGHHFVGTPEHLRSN